jgi:hypothetical protein
MNPVIKKAFRHFGRRELNVIKKTVEDLATRPSRLVVAEAIVHCDAT